MLHSGQPAARQVFSGTGWPKRCSHLASAAIGGSSLRHFRHSRLTSRWATIKCTEAVISKSWRPVLRRAVIVANAVTRQDAAVSVRAGFQGEEISALWPVDSRWRLREQRAGLFSHLFLAQCM